VVSAGRATPLRILSVAPRYRAGRTPLENGHFTIYQDDLRAAAGRMGLELVILGAADGPSAEGVLAAIPVGGPEAARAVAGAVAAQVRDGDLIMVYEGSSELLRALGPVAEARPDATFVLNLFGQEDVIDGPAVLERVDHRRPSSAARVETSEDVRELGRRLPPNLRVTAETPERVELARQAGLPVCAAWRLHSIVTTVDPVPRSRPDGPLRVLVPLRQGGFDAEPVADIAYVAHRLDRIAGHGEIVLSVTRLDTGRLASQVRGDRLARLGVRSVEPSPSRAGYAATFADHDAVWLTGAAAPSGFSYRTQSSGKTLDALAAGLPVVGVAGGYPAKEPLRWTGLPLGYRMREEAVAAFLTLRDRSAELAARLLDRRDAIRSTYSPEATLRRVIDVAGIDVAGTAASDTGQPLIEPLMDRPADLTVDAGLVEVAGPSCGGRREVILASVAARRAARIPLLRRSLFRARRRLGAARSRLLRRV